jgi:lipopolysaccharide transport system ATP-binding protein
MLAVVAEGISKQYRINIGESANTLSGRVRRFLTRDNSVNYEDIWALQDVSFSVEEGEVFGIIGRNGSGKSTLLKILTGIVRPTSGRGAVRGRVGALLEVGTGFHPDLTGRENVYFNGTLLGLDRAFIKSKFDEIVAFAEVEKFIDAQFKHYSSGMQARLGFAVAVNLHPEVLILDEVLSVGDVIFQEKSMDRMTELRQSGMTILFVSHSLGSLAGVCKRAMLLRNGHVVTIGDVDQVLEEYIPKAASGTAFVDFGEGSKHPACFLSGAVENADGTRVDHFDINEDIYIRLRYRVRAPQYGLQLALTVRIQQDDIVQTFDTDENAFLGKHEPGVFEKRVKIPRMFLKEGEYSARMTIGIPAMCYDDFESVLKFSVTADGVDVSQKSYRRGRAGRVVFPGSWLDVAAGK